MGRSQETFNKKEREKKRQKKKELKAKKKEERKANPSDKGDNITYMDVYGNFHDTPPEPPKKVKAKDIDLSQTRTVSDEPEETERKGVVTHFNSAKGYGFIKDKKNPAELFCACKQCAGRNCGKQYGNL